MGSYSSLSGRLVLDIPRTYVGSHPSCVPIISAHSKRAGRSDHAFVNQLFNCLRSVCNSKADTRYKGPTGFWSPVSICSLASDLPLEVLLKSFSWKTSENCFAVFVALTLRYWCLVPRFPSRSLGQ
jgi:hypothetical protein